MFFDPPIGAGAHLFLWIVGILIGSVVALSFVDVLRTHKPSEEPIPENYDSYWKSRKHAEDVHKEFPRDKPMRSTDPRYGDDVK